MDRARGTVVMNGGWALLCGALFAIGCGGAQRASVSAGAMPAGGSFTGVWFSPQYGEMHIRQNGNAVVGEYSKDDRTGKIQGHATGDLLKFIWSEERELVQGRPVLSRGRGYFKYTVGQDGRDNLLGEWGIDHSDKGGGPWNAYRLRNRNPQLSTDTAGGSGAAEAPPPDWGDGPTTTDDLGGETLE